MKKYLIVILSFFVINLSPAQTFKKSDIDNIAKFMCDTIPQMMKQRKIPGIAVGIVGDNNILWTHGFGYTDVDSTVLITPFTNFSVQSMSKTFTALAVLKAAEENIVNLDALITEYIPWFTVNSIHEDNPQQKMTLRLLLSHKAGFTHEAPIGNNYEFNTGTFAEHIKSIMNTWLRYPVGDRYAYSNLGIDLAAYIIEQKSGIPFCEYVQQKILDPAGMNLSTFNPKRILEMKDRAIGHYGAPVKNPVLVPMIGAGGLYTNASDMCRFIRMILNQGFVDERRIFSENSFVSFYSIPNALAGQTDGYALGIAKRTINNSTIYNHGGGGFGFLTNMAWIPEFNVGVVVLTNAENHNFQTKITELLLERLTAIINPPQKENSNILDQLNKKIITLSPEEAKNYEGQYLYNSGGIMRLEFQDNTLGVNPGRNFSPVNFLSKEECFIVTGGIPFLYKFLLDESGAAVTIIRVYDGERLNLNDRPDEPAGIFKDEWNQYLGKYYTLSYGINSQLFEIKNRNGYLYFGHMKLKEYKPGIFFTANGEVVNLTSDPPVYRSIKLKKSFTLK